MFIATIAKVAAYGRQSVGFKHFVDEIQTKRDDLANDRITTAMGEENKAKVNKIIAILDDALIEMRKI